MPSARAVPVGSRHGQRLYGRHRHPRGRSAQPHGPALSLFALEQNGTEDWYMAGLQFDDRTQYQIREAWNHLTPHQRKNHTHGHLIASLTFGFWRNLLEDGGTIHTKWPDQRRADYENDLWRKGLDKTFSNGRQYARAVEERWTRKYALDIVKTVHALRNRVAHHEPLVNGIPLPGENRRIALENATRRASLWR